MYRVAPAVYTWLLGHDRSGRRWVLTSAGGLCLVTAVSAALGHVLLRQWPQLHAHLLIESVGLVVFLSTLVLAIVAASVTGGFLPTTIVTAAPVAGLVGYLAVVTAMFGPVPLAPPTLDTVVTLGGGLGAISLGCYLLGLVVYILQPARLQAYTYR